MRRPCRAGRVTGTDSRAFFIYRYYNSDLTHKNRPVRESAEGHWLTRQAASTLCGFPSSICWNSFFSGQLNHKRPIPLVFYETSRNWLNYRYLSVFQSSIIMFSSEKMQWFAMRATYRRGMQIKALLIRRNQQFHPHALRSSYKERAQEAWAVPVISDLIFVHSVQSELQKVKFKLPYFQYMIDIRNGQKIIVPDDQMRQFIAVAGTYDEHLIFFSPDEVNLT